MGFRQQNGGVSPGTKPEMKNWDAAEVLAFRKAHGLTRRALGEMLGITVSALYQWENEVKRPSKTARILLSRIEEELDRFSEVIPD
jgi:DNA-binding transcriptional regulator YiaG